MATRSLLSLASMLVIATGCGGHAHTPAGQDPTAARTSAAVAPTYTATQFVPAHPTFVIAARTVQGALASFAAGVDALGVPFGAGYKDFGRDLASLIHINIFEFASLAAMGVDLQGGFAAFSEDLDPTIVVHLANPEDTLAFFDRLRDGGMNTTSVISDQVELYTTQLSSRVKLSWAVAGDWLWLHFTFAIGSGKERASDTRWFTAGKPNTVKPAWGAAWGWASANAAHLPQVALALSGFVDVQAIAGIVAPRMKDELACVALAAPIGKLGFALEVGDNKAGARISIDLGHTAAAGIQRAILPAPEGWAAASANSAIGVQWNLDLDQVISTIAPCTRALSIDPLHDVEKLGVRSARAFLDAFDADNHTGQGAASLDLANAKFLTEQLDTIPMRSQLETDKQFGALAGHELSASMFGMPAVEYVLTDRLAIAATPEAVMTAVVGSGKPAASGPIATFDIAPMKLPVAAWKFLLEHADFDRPERVISHMLGWQDGHLLLSIDHDQLVFEAHGSRR